MFLVMDETTHMLICSFRILQKGKTWDRMLWIELSSSVIICIIFSSFCSQFYSLCSFFYMDVYYFKIMENKLNSDPKWLVVQWLLQCPLQTTTMILRKLISSAFKKKTVKLNVKVTSMLFLNTRICILV